MNHRVVLSDEEEPWSMDDSYRLYKMFESLPLIHLEKILLVDFSTGDK